MNEGVPLKIKAVIFDLGGTLVEYGGRFSKWPDLEVPGLTAAHNYLASVNVPAGPIEAFIEAGFEILPRRWSLATKGQVNLTVNSFIADILVRVNCSRVEQGQLAAASRLYERAICAEARPLPHGEETLRTLKNQGYKLGLLSNTMFTAQAHLKDLRKFNLASYFDAMLFSSEANMWKPNGEPFECLLDDLGVAAESTVFIGDDPAADIVGGQNAGLKAVHYKSSDRFVSPNGVVPDAVVHSLNEVPSLLKNL